MVCLLSKCTSDREYTEVSPDTLCRELTANAARAKKAYKGKNFIISGQISAIQEDAKYIEMRCGAYPNVGMVFRVKDRGIKKKIMSLDTGSYIALRCKCTDVSGENGYRFDIISLE